MGQMVEDIADVGNAQEPSGIRSTGFVKNVIGISFNSSNTAFGKILMLMMRFTLPLVNVVGSCNISNLLTDFDLGSITQKLIHSSTMANIVLEGMDKLLVCFHGINIGD
jgi:hypothetical protein